MDQSQDAIHRELKRHAHDVIRIYNPLDIVFKYRWDGFPYSIGPKETKDVSRYLADHYFKHISQKIIGDLQQVKGTELLTRRKKHGDPDYLDPYIENREVWDKVPSFNDEELLIKIRDQVILGLVEKFGMDFTEEESQPERRIDTRDIYEKVLSEDKIVNELPKKELAEEVTQDEQDK